MGPRSYKADVASGRSCHGFRIEVEQRLLVESVRAFVEEEYHHEAEVERAEVPTMSPGLREKAIAQGFYAANMPEEIGGGGLG